jgi:serine/threonine-protein phosphatase PGAM5
MVLKLLLPRVLVKCKTIDDEHVRQAQYGQWRSWERQWVSDWDGRHPREGSEALPGKRKVRHVVLVRHGQYSFDDKKLTDLGREQARVTGQRLREMTERPISDHYGTIHVKWKHFAHSDVARAKETAELIAKELKEVPAVLDPILAEGWPCLPQSYSKEVRPAKLLEDSARIESAFRKYVKRVRDHKKDEKHDEGVGADDATEEHEYTLLVCHQNVIRYFVCRALQLPPEYWLRFKGDNCGITEIIIYDDGRTSLAKFADVGHLDISQHTFH